PDLLSYEKPAFAYNENTRNPFLRHKFWVTVMAKAKREIATAASVYIEGKEYDIDKLSEIQRRAFAGQIKLQLLKPVLSDKNLTATLKGGYPSIRTAFSLCEHKDEE
ncbi:MAG: hypothetical protein DIU81_002370, partial [[Clostridium] cellulosi]